MRVVIAGCGRVGSQLARWFSEGDHDVTVIDRREQTLRELGRDFNGTYVIGEAYDVDVLDEAGLADADVFLAVTDSDNANLMAAEVATKVFGVNRSIARLYDPIREKAYEALNVQFVTGTKIIAAVIYEQVIAEAFTLHTTFADESEVEIVEFTVSAGASGVPVSDLEVPGRLRVAAVERNGVVRIPSPDDLLEPGDLVVASARSGVRSRIARYLEEPES